MLIGFKTQLKLNHTTRTQLAKHAGVARHAWNWGLALTKQILDNNKANPNEKIRFPTAIDLHKWLVALVKPENLWYYEVSKCAPQYALRHLREAWDRCFKRISGVPRFKKKGRHDSFTLDGSVKLDHFKIKVPVLGWLKTYERLPQGFTPKSVTISRHADRWFISFQLEVEPTITDKAVRYLGVDLGVTTLATLSTGFQFSPQERGHNRRSGEEGSLHPTQPSSDANEYPTKGFPLLPSQPSGSLHITRPTVRFVQSKP